MPRDDGLGLYDDQALPPAGKTAKDEGPESLVSRGQGEAGRPVPEKDSELMPEGEVLGEEGGARSRDGEEGGEGESGEIQHERRIRGATKRRTWAPSASRLGHMRFRSPAFRVLARHRNLSIGRSGERWVSRTVDPFDPDAARGVSVESLPVGCSLFKALARKPSVGGRL